MTARMHNLRNALCSAALALGTLLPAHASPVSVLAMKVSDSSTGNNALDVFNTWSNAGGFNESNAAAQLLINNGLDYKSSIVDTSWSSVQSVRVAMYSQGVMQAYMDFNPSVNRTSFYGAPNLTGSNYTDLGAFSGNFFSIAGDARLERHWFVQQSYAGCGRDFGWFVVLDRRTAGTYDCAWENNGAALVGSAERGFLYALDNHQQQWGTSGIGVADTFAVFVTIDDGNRIPEPATFALAATALGAGWIARRRTKKQV